MHAWHEKEKFAQFSEALWPFMARSSVKHTGRIQEGARIHRQAESQQPSCIPRDFWLSRSVCWHSSTPLTFSLTPYQNVFLSHTPPALGPFPFTPHEILVQLFPLVVRFDRRVPLHTLFFLIFWFLCCIFVSYLTLERWKQILKIHNCHAMAKTVFAQNTQDPFHAFTLRKWIYKKHKFKQSVCMKCEIKLYTRNIASEHILFGAESLNRPK